MAHILVVDDENAMLQLIKRVLEKDGHCITLQVDPEAVPDMDFRHYDLILLDIMMPGIDGFEICSQIRSYVDCPIIFLTAKTQEADVVRGLGLGGDDYITKPFGTNELRARVNAHLRRDTREKKYAVSITGVTFHLKAKEAEVNSNRLPLTKKEYDICEYLALHRGQVFSREQIYEAVFGFEGESDDNVIATHVKNIRHKLEAAGLSPIETVWGGGLQMGVKKLRSVFMRYMMIVAGGILLIGAVNIGLYALCMSAGIIIPVVQVENDVMKAKENLQAGTFFTEEDIPDFCDYALFTPDGLFKQGTLTQETAASLWETCVIEGNNKAVPYLISVINRKNEIILLRYRNTTQFSNTALRHVFPATDLLLVGGIVIEAVILLLLISCWFGKYTGKKIEKLLTVTKKIEKQDLDFKVESSGIFEIDRALAALEHLKQALKISLMEQWQSEKIRQDQISALAHDLKTPLTIVRGNNELLYNTALSDEQRECADYIESCSIQMQNYVQTLIEITRSKERFPFHFQRVEMTSLLREIYIQAKSLCSLKNVLLKWKENIPVKYISVDKEQLIRAVINIFSNAVEYTPAEGYILFRAYEDSGHILFTITDTGNGFSAEALKRATEQFYMDDSSRHSKSHYGIGLYTANTIINQHAGQLILENSRETGGARVTVRLPY